MLKPFVERGNMLTPGQSKTYYFWSGFSDFLSPLVWLTLISKTCNPKHSRGETSRCLRLDAICTLAYGIEKFFADQRPSAQVHGLLPSRFLALRIWNLDNIDHEVWPQKQPTKRCQGLSSFVVRLEDSLCQNSRNDCCDINLTGYHRMLIVLVFQKRAGSRPQMCFQIFQVRKKLRKNNANSISFNSVVTATWKQTSAGVKRAATFWRAIRGVAVKGSTTGWDIWLITLFRLYIFLNLRL